MNEVDTHSILQSLFQMSLLTTMFVLLGFMAIKSAKSLSSLISKKRISLKLKKYDLKKYDIYFNSNGLPVALVEKDNNQIIFI